ncbi:MAG: hypothetical protein ABF379_08570 [Akkermansiaceae bacterium]
MPGCVLKGFCEDYGNYRPQTLLSEKAHNEVLLCAATERICNAYHQNLEGKFITADFRANLIAKIGALRSPSSLAAPLPYHHVPMKEETLVVGEICLPSENHNDPAMPTSGPTTPPNPGRVPGDFSK